MEFRILEIFHLLVLTHYSSGVICLPITSIPSSELSAFQNHFTRVPGATERVSSTSSRGSSDSTVAPEFWEKKNQASALLTADQDIRSLQRKPIQQLEMRGLPNSDLEAGSNRHITKDSETYPLSQTINLLASSSFPGSVTTSVIANADRSSTASSSRRISVNIPAMIGGIVGGSVLLTLLVLVQVIYYWCHYDAEEKPWNSAHTLRFDSEDPSDSDN
ncbi:hypothetical protein VKT23_012520 [Stygiomarasmius scandens]|uniref:Uncharacterized protein n=1 Tax=Marasmiellus scandens TaxID=2682957 RepID=A0ABR1J5D8_9AGAR